jgi:hypothetical protein
MMTSKGEISTNAVYIIVITVMTIILAFIGLGLVGDWLGSGASEGACTQKLVDFCTSWQLGGFGDDPFDWETVEPTGCDEFEVYKPTREECENLISV